MDELIKISESNKQFPVSARELYEKLGFNISHWAEWCSTNILDNEFIGESIDFEVYAPTAKTSGGRPSRDFNLTIDFAKTLCMMARTEKGEEIRRYFIEVEKRYQAITNRPRPETQLEVLQQVINLMVEQDKRQKQLEERTESVERTLTLVKDTIIQQDPDWRKWINQMFNKIVHAVGSEKYQQIRADSYRLLEERAHCDLDTRLRNLKQRFGDSGATKTKIEKLNKLDVIENEPKLKEIYTGIIKEMTIKFVA